MLPPPQSVQQGEMMRQMMMQGQGQEDPLMAALGKQQALGEMLKERASHALKMYKIRMKYGSGPQAPAQVPPSQGAMGPQGQTYY